MTGALHVYQMCVLFSVMSSEDRIKVLMKRYFFLLVKDCDIKTANVFHHPVKAKI